MDNPSGVLSPGTGGTVTERRPSFFSGLWELIWNRHPNGNLPKKFDSGRSTVTSPDANLYDEFEDLGVSPVPVDESQSARVLRVYSAMEAGKLPLLSKPAFQRTIDRYENFLNSKPRLCADDSAAAILQGLVTSQNNPTLAGRLTANMLGYRLLPLLVQQRLQYSRTYSVIVDTPAYDLCGSDDERKRAIAQLADERVQMERHFYNAIGIGSSVDVLLSSDIDQDPKFKNFLEQAKDALGKPGAHLSEADRAPGSFGYFVYQTALFNYMCEFRGVQFKFGVAGEESDRDEVRFDTAMEHVFPAKFLPLYGHMARNTAGNKFAPYLGTDAMKANMPLFGPNANFLAFFIGQAAKAAELKPPNWYDSLATQVTTFEDIVKPQQRSGWNYPTELNDDTLSPYGIKTTDLSSHATNDESDRGHLGFRATRYFRVALSLDFINRNLILTPAQLASAQSLMLTR